MSEDIQVVVARSLTGDGSKVIFCSQSIQSTNGLPAGNSVESNGSTGNGQVKRPPGIGSRCLWDACRASILGLFLLISGIVFALYEFSSHFTSADSGGLNKTLTSYNYYGHPAVAKLKVSYIGPILIGTGSFILIAVGVVTLEMRDLASKVFPQTIKRHPPPSKLKLSQDKIIELFQTPAMRLVKELASSKRCINSHARSVASQTPTARNCQRYRSCHQLSSTNADTVRYVFKRHRRHRKWRLVEQKRKFPGALSCPHLDNIS